MKHTHSQRKSIIAWRQKLQALANAVDTGDANRDLRELHALDIAMIESGIYGLLAMMKNIATARSSRTCCAIFWPVKPTPPIGATSKLETMRPRTKPVPRPRRAKET